MSINDKNKFYWTIGIIVFSLFVIIIIIYAFLTKDIGKAKKVSDINMSYPTVTDDQQVIYYNSKNNAIEELNLTTNQTQTIAKIDAEMVFSILWSPQNNKAIINLGTKDYSIDKFVYFSLDKKTFNSLDDKTTDFAWSSAGDKIAFVVNDEDSSSINIANFDGSNNKIIYKSAESLQDNDITLIWSKDDSKIGVSISPTDVGASTNFVINLKDLTQAKLNEQANGPINEWSSNSDKMTLQIINETNSNYSWGIQDFLTGKIQKINFDGLLNWTLDNKTLLGANNKGIWKINAKNSAKTMVYQSDNKKNAPVDYIVKFDDKTNTVYFISNNNFYKVLIKK